MNGKKQPRHCEVMEQPDQKDAFNLQVLSIAAIAGDSSLIVSYVSSAPRHLLELRGRHFNGCRWPKRLCRSHHHIRDLHGSVCAVLCAVFQAL